MKFEPIYRAATLQDLGAFSNALRSEHLAICELSSWDHLRPICDPFVLRVCKAIDIMQLMQCMQHMESNQDG